MDLNKLSKGFPATYSTLDGKVVKVIGFVFIGEVEGTFSNAVLVWDANGDPLYHTPKNMGLKEMIKSPIHESTT